MTPARKIINDDVCARLGQPLRPDAAIHANDESEAPGMSGFDTRERILEHHSTLHRYAELFSSSDEGIR